MIAYLLDWMHIRFHEDFIVSDVFDQSEMLFKIPRNCFQHRQPAHFSITQPPTQSTLTFPVSLRSLLPASMVTTTAT